MCCRCRLYNIRSSNFTIGVIAPLSTLGETQVLFQGLHLLCFFCVYRLGILIPCIIQHRSSKDRRLLREVRFEWESTRVFYKGLKKIRWSHKSYERRFCKALKVSTRRKLLPPSEAKHYHPRWKPWSVVILINQRCLFIL